MVPTKLVLIGGVGALAGGIYVVGVGYILRGPVIKIM